MSDEPKSQETNRCVMCGKDTHDISDTICGDCYNLYSEDIKRYEAESYARWMREEEYRQWLLEDD